ncbi:MAG: nucleoside triphosphate pyrophosphohydrolase family protein [Xanthobacteraceae bacterium]|jgi:NTP pyrophosphatase (non-canonical NTP hydrolase)
MTIDDYAEWAATVAKVTADPGSEKFSYLGLGLSAESGEVADLIKKLLRDGTLDRAALIEELGDVIYYWCCLCVASGQKPSELLAKSREKITGRLSAAGSREA